MDHPDGMFVGNKRPLRPGDIVEVRPPSEILATLDDDGTLDSVPFMPEMVQFTGRRFTVSGRVEKICDTIALTGSRRIRDTVYLEDLRCDGSGHGGCQAACRIYWKEAWLRRVDEGADAVVHAQPGSPTELERRVQDGAQTVRELDGKHAQVWRCQATEAVKASEPLRTLDVRQYWRELRSGNFGLLRFLLVAARGFLLEVGIRVRVIGWIPLKGDGSHPSPGAPLDLQPGELVQVRSKTEIAPTLDANGRNLGLSFDREMLPYCGRTFRVKDRVQRIIDERTGRMIHISRDCVMLEGVLCSGERSVGRLFCPRQIFPYWREAWLRRVEGSVESPERR
jgi:hypothetical protein